MNLDPMDKNEDEDHMGRLRSELHDAILAESDRGCVLVSCSWIEEQLGNAIKSLLIAVREIGTPAYPEKRSVVEYVNGPLESCRWGRRMFCRATGLTDKSLDKAVESLFAIRNGHFAHFPKIVSFDDPSVSKPLEDFLKNVGKLGPVDDYLKLSTFSEAVSHSRNRKEFMDATSHLGFYLVRSMLRIVDTVRRAEK